MIKSFKDKDARRLLDGKRVRKFEAIAERAERKLRLLEVAIDLQSLNLPSNQLEKLKSGRTGQHSIRINDQWRVCFEWKKDGAYNVESSIIIRRAL